MKKLMYVMCIAGGLMMFSCYSDGDRYRHDYGTESARDDEPGVRGRGEGLDTTRHDGGEYGTGAGAGRGTSPGTRTDEGEMGTDDEGSVRRDEDSEPGEGTY